MLQGNVCRAFWQWQLLSGVVAVFLLVGAVPASAAQQTYRFDPLLSLVGGCLSPNAEDLVQDPGCPGGNHPPEPFDHPQSVTTDPSGDIYIASYGSEAEGANGAEGRIDVFGPDGSFITELPDPRGPRNLAVDNHGNLYVFEYQAGFDHKLVRYSPTTYKPVSGEIAYEEQVPAVLLAGLAGSFSALSIDPANEHLFAHRGSHIDEFDSAENGNALLTTEVGEGTLSLQSQAVGLSVDSAHGRIYASDLVSGKGLVRVFDLSGQHSLLETIDGSTLPAGKYGGEPSIAVAEGTGDLFTYTAESSAKPPVNRQSSDGAFIEAIEHGLGPIFRGSIGVDNGETSPNRGHLFVPSNNSSADHVFAFGPSEVCLPLVSSPGFGNVTATEAGLTAVVNPCNATTSYTFEYTSEADYEAQGFEGAKVAVTGELAATKADFAVSASVSGLLPGTTYRFRIVAVNEAGPAEDGGRFTTYLPEETQPCPNDALRTGPSAELPDCRAFELVTPPDTNSRAALGVDHAGTYFRTREASPDGAKVSFRTEGGAIPGFPGTGFYHGDPYLSERTPDGWKTLAAGPTGEEASKALPGSPSEDQAHSFWTAQGEGSAVVEGSPTEYVRYPDGQSALVGRGALRTDPRAEGKLISPNGTHILFRSSVALEEQAPPSGTQAIYDRTPDEVTHVVSLLPEDKTPKAGENAAYAGASLDGRGVAFVIGTTLYLRRDDTATYEIGNGLTFAGIAEGGGRIFYLQAGNLKAFDVGSGETISFTTSGNATPVNVSADGSGAYFVSPSVLPSNVKPAKNPQGGVPAQNGENLYLSKEGAISFVGTVTKRDVDGELAGNVQLDGLGLWVDAVQHEQFGRDPSRTTPDGSVLLFESRANLTGYDSEEHAVVYHYDSVGSLDCVSCNPTGAVASSDASLQSISIEQGKPEPLSPWGFVNNLRSDGRRAFFQSSEALVPVDTDSLQDIYEWEDQGVGSCTRPGGCVYLISSGSSLRTDYLYAISDSGNDVFFTSSDLLVPADIDETPSIYDARVEGGFAAATGAGPCEGEGCRPSLSPAPTLLPPESAVSAVGSGSKKCPRGRHKVKRKGKTHCVKPHHKHKHHRQRAGADKGAGK